MDTVPMDSPRWVYSRQGNVAELDIECSLKAVAAVGWQPHSL